MMPIKIQCLDGDPQIVRMDGKIKYRYFVTQGELFSGEFQYQHVAIREWNKVAERINAATKGK